MCAPACLLPPEGLFSFPLSQSLLLHTHVALHLCVSYTHGHVCASLLTALSLCVLIPLQPCSVTSHSCHVQCWPRPPCHLDETLYW